MMSQMKAFQILAFRGKVLRMKRCGKPAQRGRSRRERYLWGRRLLGAVAWLVLGVGGWNGCGGQPALDPAPAAAEEVAARGNAKATESERVAAESSPPAAEGGGTSAEEPPPLETMLKAGVLALKQGDLSAARAHYDAAAQRAEAEGDTLNLARARFGQGEIALLQRRLAEAEAFYAQARDWFVLLRYDRGEANVLLGLGHAARGQQKPDRAVERYRAALAIYQRIDDRGGQADAHRSLGYAMLALSNWEMARQELLIALRLYGEEKDLLGSAQSHYALARLAEAAGRRIEGRRHALAARAAYTQLGQHESAQAMQQLADRLADRLAS